MGSQELQQYGNNSLSNNGEFQLYSTTNSLVFLRVWKSLLNTYNYKRDLTNEIQGVE